MRLVHDTNILIAALIKNSITRCILLLPDLEFLLPPLPLTNSPDTESRSPVRRGSNRMSSICC